MQRSKDLSTPLDGIGAMCVKAGKLPMLARAVQGRPTAQISDAFLETTKPNKEEVWLKLGKRKKQKKFPEVDRKDNKYKAVSHRTKSN